MFNLSAARKHIVESVFGQIKRIRGFCKFLLRGLESVSAEGQWICLTHNLLKICRHVFSVDLQPWRGLAASFYRHSDDQRLQCNALRSKTVAEVIP